MISILMVKPCDASLCKSLELIFKSSLESGKFPLEWKKANVVPAHKKGYKQLDVILDVAGFLSPLEQYLCNRFFFPRILPVVIKYFLNFSLQTQNVRR